MNSANEDESSRPLLDTPEVAVVQPDKEKKGFDSPKEQKEERGKVPLEEELIIPEDADPIQKMVHCAMDSPLDYYYYPDHNEFDNESLNLVVDDRAEIPVYGSSQIPALERDEPWPPEKATMDECVQEPALERDEPLRPDMVSMVHCANDSPLDYYYYPDHNEFDNESLNLIVDDRAEIPVYGSSQIPALERDEPLRPDMVSDECAQEPALHRLAPAPEKVTMKRVREPAIERPVKEEPIIAEKTDGGLERQTDLKKEQDDRLSLQDRKNFEKEMDEILEAGDLDDINEWITPEKLTKCATNCLEKSLEVSHTLKCLAKAKGPDADDLCALGKSVEEFAVQLLEPLKSNELKRAIFEGGDFDRVADKAVKYRQKKFISHPVVYNFLTRQRWKGYFDQMRYSKIWFKWFLLNLWVFFDVFLFPVVHALLWVIHLIIEYAKKRQEIRVVFLLNASWKYADTQFRAMQSTAEYIMQQRKSDKTRYATVTRDYDGPIVREFTSSGEAIGNMPKPKDVKHPKREVKKNKDAKDDVGFLDCLKEANDLFEKTEKSRKVLVVMTDDKFGAPNNKLLRAAESLKQQNIKVISVGLGVHPEIKELETMGTSSENVFLMFSDNSDTDEKKKLNILESIKEKDIYDRYVRYFKTPYFIFFRDTLSYLALLGLHFTMCLQPSTLHFTAVEWIISVFFLGRLLMEINQFIMEKNSDWTENNDLSQQEHKAEEKPKEDDEEEEMKEKEKEKSTSAEDGEEDKQDKQDKKDKRTQELKKLWRIMSSYFDDWWNILDVVTLIVFLVLVGIRAFTWSQNSSISKNRLLAVAGYLYGLNAMLLTLRVFGHIMESMKSTGSIQIALFQIITAVIAIFGQFVAATVAFSLVITKIYVAEVSYNSGANVTSSGLCGSRNGFNCWWSFTRYLTWSLLGIAELSPLESSDDTSDVLAKILYGLFLIMGVVMLMNMMIALLSNTYQHVEDNAFYEWSFKKATTIRTYNKYHPVPVPFNIITLTFILLRHIYTTIKCTKCKRNKPRHRAMPPITAVAETSIEMIEIKEKRSKKEATRKSLFDSLVEDLQSFYFAMYGYTFPLADDNKMDRVLKETEGCHQLFGHIAERTFRYDHTERKSLEPHGHPDWKTKGIDVVGQRLVHVSCQCTTCLCNDEIMHHGAKYLNPLSKEYPEFEVLIQESGERRYIAIGVVTKEYELHKFPGWDGNTAGYHIDDGKIFDSAHSILGREGDDAMAYRGDLIGCKILYDQQKDGKLPVSFTLNGRVVGEAKLTRHTGFASGPFYPYVGMGSKGIVLLFRMCPKVSLPSTDSDHVIQMLGCISEQLQKMSERQTELEWKIDHLSKSLALQ